MASGRRSISITRLGQRNVLRLVVVSPQTTLADLQETIAVLRHGIKHGPHHVDLFYGTPSPGPPSGDYGDDPATRLATSLASVEHDDALVAAVGTEWATQQCEELLRRGAPGVHFYTLNRSPATRAILQQLRQG